MTISKETFVDLQEKYEKVVKLIEEDSKLDPENEPYLSKYSARQVLIGMKANLENLLRSHSSEAQENSKITAMLGAVYLYLGTVCIDTEEISAGEKHLEKCKETLQNIESTPEVILISLNMYNQFGILWSQREPKTSQNYLEKSEKLYSDFKKTTETPIDISDLFRANATSYDANLALKNLEKTHTLTLYYLAQIYGELKDALKSAIYCHITLQRQLDVRENDYDPIDWALNAATLSQFFMEKCGFKQARHHLAASSCILDEFRTELSRNETQNEAHEAKIERCKHRSADVARCWMKYGLFLLSKSKDRLMAHTDDIDATCKLFSDLSKLQFNTDSTVSLADLQNLDFIGLDVSSYEQQITDKFVLTFNDAKNVFLNIQSWSSKACDYYNLENHASDYIEIVQDQSQMYLNLLFFEENPDNQAKFHKRRIDLLENVLNQVNSKYYLQYCRQIWFELGQCYSDILDIKIDKLREAKDRPKPQTLTKINHLVEQSISNYKCFVNSFNDVASGKTPKKIQEDSEKAYLQAYFHIAALYGRFVTADKKIQLKNVESQYENYIFICEYVEQNEKAKEILPVEFGICKEMVALLPIKIAKFKKSV